jgi:hypothetical protein
MFEDQFLKIINQFYFYISNDLFFCFAPVALKVWLTAAGQVETPNAMILLHSILKKEKKNKHIRMKHILNMYTVIWFILI